jgi:phospholipase C
MTSNYFRSRKNHMKMSSKIGQWRQRATFWACVTLMMNAVATSAQSAASSLAAKQNETETPITHVIVLIGENRTFDHIFATYVPQGKESVSNLLSKGIVNADGTPGPHFKKALQFQATAPFKTKYFISLEENRKEPYPLLPEPTLNTAPNETTFSPGTPANFLAAIEPSLDPADLNLLTTGATGLGQSVVLPDSDTRVQNYSALPNGPFPLHGTLLPYDSYTGDTTHRLFEMWQQSDCNVQNATRQNPSGCLSDLYPFVITNYTNIGDPTHAGAIDDNGGSNSMAFYSVQEGDAPLLKSLADQYSMSDNYHQAVMGGTGANHIMIGTGDAFFWSDGHGNPTMPPAEVIANPDPFPRTDDVYTVDLGFNGDFAECANPTQPGVRPIREYLKSLPYDADPNCKRSHFYLINNTNPGFLPDGTVDTAGISTGASLPPTNVRTIGEALNDKDISWAYYGGAYDAAVALEQDPTNPSPFVQVGAAYCNICNFESYTNVIMGDPTQRAAHIKDATDFFAAIDNNTLPSVSFVKPDALLDGHPATSKIDLFEGMIKQTLDHLNANPGLMAQTALFITMDEGGGYYDSGYIQPIDFFGDGPRTVLIVVSPFTTGGHISHVYADHVSILKFIERNWRLSPLTGRSRDNLPNPIADGDPYVPVNSPAISDLFDMFHFGGGHD